MTISQEDEKLELTPSGLSSLVNPFAAFASFHLGSRTPRRAGRLMTISIRYHFNDKSVALPGHLLCIIPKVGMKNLSFYLPAINEILNEIAVAIYHILWQFIITFRQRYQGDFITFRQGYHCDFISPG
jgi:hypothetical protein